LLDINLPLIEAGFSLHWLHMREKRPIGDDWSEKPINSAHILRKSYLEGNNIGVRLGEPSKVAGYYLQVIDVDIRDPALEDTALDALWDFIPDFETYPTVKSGSDGPSFHVYFLTDRPFRSKKLAHSVGKIVGKDGKQHWAWEVELFGTGKQVAAPPSIHPDTGRPYRWVREFDFEALDLGLGPIINSSVIATWAPAAQTIAASEDEDDDLIGLAHSAPGDFTDAQITETLALLPLAEWCEDRDGWLQVGMVLHHQFEGAEAGYDRWVAFSKQSPKFNPKDQRRVWKSFSAKPGGVRFATLRQAAAIERERLVEAGEDTFDDDDEADDLIGAAPAEVDVDVPSVNWDSLLDRTEEGALKPTLHNTVLIVRNDPRTKGIPALNLFTQEVVQRKAPGRAVKQKLGPKGCKQLTGPIWEVSDPVNGDMWGNARDVSIRDVLEAPKTNGGHGIKIADRDLRGAVDLVARENRFHPVREYLLAQKWDGVPRVETLFINYLGAEDSAYMRSVARLFLIAAVARVFEPGHKFDFAPILEGVQGKRKSTFISILGKNWFSELDGDVHDSNKMVEKMQGSWILEIPELSSLNRSDVEQVKAFISRQVDKVRLAYERRAEMYKRQCVLMGSTNNKNYLRDDTGARRFWPIECFIASIPTDKLLDNIDTIWAEAYHLYRTMRTNQPQGTLPLYLTNPAAVARAIELQESRRVENAEDGQAGRIDHWLNEILTDESGMEDEGDVISEAVRNETCLLELWVECFRRDVSSYGQMQAQQLGRAIKKVEGWSAVGSRPTARYGRQRVFRRTGYDPD
jgi:hypothetical protein